MTSQEKKRWLQRYRILDQEINQRLDQIDALRATAERTTTVLSDMPGSGGFKSREDIYIKLIDMSNEVNKLVDGYVDKKREAERQRNNILSAIRALDDPSMEALMYMRYIDCCDFEEIAVTMAYCIRHVWRLHGNALQRLEVTNFIKGIVELKKEQF